MNRLILILIFAISAQAQESKLDSLIYAWQKEQIILAHQETATAREEMKRGKWLNLLPSISYNATSNSINVGVNLNSFSNYYQLGKRNEIALNNILEQKLAALQQTTNKLLEQSELHAIALAELNLVKSGHDIEIELFEISTQSYQNNKIDLVTFLQSKKKFIQSEKQLQAATARADRIYNKIILKFTNERIPSHPEN